MKGLILLVFVLFIVGCTNALYVQPDSEDSAKLKILNNTGVGIDIGSFKEASSCSGMVDLVPPPTFVESLGPSRDMATGSSIEILIEPNQLFSFFANIYYSNYPINYQCILPATFKPTPRTSYVAEFSMGGQMCYVSMVRIDRNGNYLKEPSFKARKHRTPLTTAGSSCKGEYN